MPVWGPRGGGARGREGGKWRSIDPVLPLTDTAILDSITAFYGLDCSFPLASQLVMRSQMEIKRPKRLYFVSSGEPSPLRLPSSPPSPLLRPSFSPPSPLQILPLRFEESFTPSSRFPFFFALKEPPQVASMH